MREKLFVIFLSLISFTSIYASERISYTGRLVNANGSPKIGPINIQFNVMVGNIAPLTNKCSLTVSSVPLSNGVFNVEIDYATTCEGSTKSLSTIVNEALTASDKIWMQVTEDPAGFLVAHGAQQIIANPMSLVAITARGLSPQSINELAFSGIAAGCANGEILKSDGAGNFACAADSGGAATGDIDAVNTPAGSGLTGGATTGAVSLSIALDGATLSKTVTGLKVTDGGIAATQLATDAVTTIKITDSNVTAAKLATDSVIEAKIQNGAVTVNKIGAGAVSATKLATDAVETAKIKDLNITEAKIATGSVTATKIGSDAVTAVKIQSQGLKDIAGITHLIDELFISNGTNIIATSIPTCSAGEVLTFKRPPLTAFGCVTDTGGTGPTSWSETGSVTHLTNANNVGIGTNSATEKLTVDGNIKVTTGNDVCIDGGNCLSTVSLGIFTQSSTDAYYTTGNVGIGTISPIAKLDIAGAIVGRSIDDSSGEKDFSTGNIQYTSEDCGSFDFHNMKDGAAYTFIVQGTTSALCSFNAYSDAGTTALTIHMPTDHAVSDVGAGNDKHTIYNFMVAGGHIYVAWVTGM